MKNKLTVAQQNGSWEWTTDGPVWTLLAALCRILDAVGQRELINAINDADQMLLERGLR